VLFSNPEIAKFVRENFVAAWESVRPVPLVTIDFGNGTMLNRTVNGNIATYLCAPDGRVLDIIPALNAPKAYLDDLAQALKLYGETRQGHFDATVLGYHRTKATRNKAATEIEVRREIGEEAALLDLDTEINRNERKPLIHALLAERVYRPADITKRVYKEILHCDLDDPYLGLVSKAFRGGAYENR
jgi:hypothetical protein